MTGIFKLSKRRSLKEFCEGPIPSVEEGLLRRIKTGTILDFGCGKGVGMKRFLKRGWQTIGFDPQLDDLKIAKIFGNVVCGVGEWIPFADETFDVVISSHVLHHMADPQKGLQEIFRCLRSRGYLLLAETVEDNPLLKLARNMNPYFEGVPVRSRYTRTSLRCLIKTNHFTMLEEDVWGLFVWIYVELARRSKTLAKISYLLPSMMDSLETYLLIKVKPLRKYCLQHYILAYKETPK